MTNFVLTGLPDFIVVGSPWQTSRPRPGEQPAHVDSTFAEVLVLLGASYDRHELTDAIAYSDAGNVAMNRVIGRFGFERRPETFAELYGLLDYCDRLTALSGVGFTEPDAQPAWQARSALLLSRQRPGFLRAVELFCAGDLDGLRTWHRDPDALLHIGRTYRRLL